MLEYQKQETQLRKFMNKNDLSFNRSQSPPSDLVKAYLRTNFITVAENRFFKVEDLITSETICLFVDKKKKVGLDYILERRVLIACEDLTQWKKLYEKIYG